MCSLRQRRYGLSCGRRSRGASARRTFFHVKLTDAAIKALQVHRNLKETLPGQPSICFQGNQGYIKIPAPMPETPSALRIFSFYLSSESKDQPQASFDCIHQYVSSDGREQVEGQGVIHDKITVCATEESYQTTRQRMSQVEKDSWIHTAIEIKPGATHQTVKAHKRLSPLCASDSRRNDCVALQPPFRQRIIHLLALKAYRKPELLLWMERERASPRNKAELDRILEEVAKVNPKDSSYVLMDHIYKLVQKDWPSYSEEDKQLIGPLLARKLPNCSHQPRNFQSHTSVLMSSEELNHNLVKNPAWKSPLPSDLLGRFTLKRQRLAENGLLSHKSQNAAAPSLSPSLPLKTDFSQANALTDTQNGFPVLHKLLSMSEPNFSVGRKQETKLETQSQPDCPQQLLPILHKKKKSKKHKDKERDWLTDDKDGRWFEMSKQKPIKSDNPDITKTAEEKLDYVLTYSPIMSLEQRQSYQEDFCSEYDEYKGLHSRIATITNMFVQLGSRIKSLSPGTPEYKIMEDQILERYSKYRKKFPGYREEKKRCEYLHEKLSYIKQLIIDFDESQASTWPSCRQNCSA